MTDSKKAPLASDESVSPVVNETKVTEIPTVDVSVDDILGVPPLSDKPSDFGEVNPPSSDVKSGLSEASEVNPPVGEVNPPVGEVNPPVGEVNPPVKEETKTVDLPMDPQNDVLVPENDVSVISPSAPLRINNQGSVTSDQGSPPKGDLLQRGMDLGSRPWVEVTSNQSFGTAQDKQPVISGQEPVVNSQPMADNRPSITNGYQSPNPGYRPPITNQTFNRGFNRTFVPRSPYEIPDANLPTETISGVLDVTPIGHGYLRPNRVSSNKDVYVSMSQIRRFNMRAGDIITGQARQPKENERYWGLLKVEKVNGNNAEEAVERPVFDDLTPIFPDKQLKLEFDQTVLTTRMIDLFSPIGLGQRGLIVSPPKAGKTWLLKDVSTAVAKNYPELMLIGVLIGERPEEVTDLSQHIKEVTNNVGEMYPSNFDEPAQDQIHVAELALERAKRLVEQGKDVVMILDSITRLARAYNMAMPNSGRTLSGGFDPQALFPAKHYFGAARKIQDGGSLTIIGTCLVDTGSRMDDLIYEEFKGTGNMELHLDRKMAERRVFPAFDIQRSGTRQEERLYDKDIYDRIVMMRRMADMLNNDERTEVFVERLKKSKTNKEFLDALTKQGK